MALPMGSLEQTYSSFGSIDFPFFASLSLYVYVVLLQKRQDNLFSRLSTMSLYLAMLY